jgi:hypothetical protein
MVAHSVLHLSFYHCQHDTVWWDSSVGAQAFMGALLPRLRAANNGPSPIMPFELEVVFCLEVWHHLSHGKNYKEMHWIHAQIPISGPLSWKFVFSFLDLSQVFRDFRAEAFHLFICISGPGCSLRCVYCFLWLFIESNQVVEAALISRTQRLEQTLMDVEPQVRLTALNMIWFSPKKISLPCPSSCACKAVANNFIENSLSGGLGRGGHYSWTLFIRLFQIPCVSMTQLTSSTCRSCKSCFGILMLMECQGA